MTWTIRHGADRSSAWPPDQLIKAAQDGDVASLAAVIASSKVRIAAFTYHDPFLADYLSGPLTTDFAGKKVKVADVATVFGTYIPFTTTTTLPGFGTVPVAVANICTLTWMCAAKPQGPNIHANATGYKKIAKALATELG